MAFSSGNHAQGVAAAAQLLGMPAVIVMPSDAPRPKRERTAALGAEVVLYDRDTRGSRRRSRATSPRSAAPCWCRPTTIRWSSPGRARPAARSWRIWPRSGSRPTWWWSAPRAAGLPPASRSPSRRACRGANFYTAEPEGFDDMRARSRAASARSNAALSGTICDALMAQHAGRAHLRDQSQADRRRASRRATRRSAARSRSRSANSSSWSSPAAPIGACGAARRARSTSRARSWSRCCPAAMSIRSCSTGWSA